MHHAATSARASHPRFSTVDKRSVRKKIMPNAWNSDDVAGKYAVTSSVRWMVDVRPVCRKLMANGRWYQWLSTLVIPWSTAVRVRLIHEPRKRVTAPPAATRLNRANGGDDAPAAPSTGVSSSDPLESPRPTHHASAPMATQDTKSGRRRNAPKVPSNSATTVKIDSVSTESASNATRPRQVGTSRRRITTPAATTQPTAITLNGIPIRNRPSVTQLRVATHRDRSFPDVSERDQPPDLRPGATC